jgi:hypothetical protein
METGFKAFAFQTQLVPPTARCAARTALHVNGRWAAETLQKHAHTIAVGSLDRGDANQAAKGISFAGPLVLNARLKRQPKVPKSNGEMEDLGALTAEQRRLLPERDVLDTLHYKSCAVVGNGGLLLMYEHGDIIDAHDAVIRFNDATTKEPFAKHAGSKTTIRLVNSQHRGRGAPDVSMNRSDNRSGNRSDNRSDCNRSDCDAGLQRVPRRAHPAAPHRARAPQAVPGEPAQGRRRQPRLRADGGVLQLRAVQAAEDHAHQRHVRAVPRRGGAVHAESS